MESPKPEPQHQWLQQMVGDWTFESEAVMGLDQPPIKSSGTERVRSIGELWIQGEGASTMPDGNPALMLITVAYDPQKQRFVGTWIGSMMPRLWVYDGFLEGNKLTLESEGPSFADPAKTALYRDAIEVRSADHRVFTGSVRNDDGTWTTFMTSHYHRAR